jgi:hypothetical protein
MQTKVHNVNKKDAREMLNVNQTQLAAVLCISRSHLSRMKALGPAQIKIVQGEMAQIILRDAMRHIELLEDERKILLNKLGVVVTVAGGKEYQAPPGSHREM